MLQIIPTAEPFFFPAPKTSSNSVGCLLVHGFTGTPKEMRGMGEYLARQGYSVLGIRLTGHATQPDDMRRSRCADWTVSVEDGYQLLRGVADNIYLVGLSMGGVLSLLMSTRLDVKGVVAMSTPYRLPVNYPAVTSCHIGQKSMNRRGRVGLTRQPFASKFLTPKIPYIPLEN
jgi:carboxylesterase